MKRLCSLSTCHLPFTLVIRHFFFSAADETNGTNKCSVMQCQQAEDVLSKCCTFLKMFLNVDTKET